MRLRSDWVISGVGHAAILVAGLVTIASAKQDADASIFVPVSVVTSADVSQAPQGQTNAPKVATPKPLADKVDTPKPVQQDAPKVSDKPAITTAAAPAPAPPKPEPKPPEKHPKKPPPGFKPDQIAALLDRDDPKKTPKPPDKPAPQKTTPEPPKFDASQVATLLDKRDPQRQTATAETANGTPNLGASNGQAVQLSQSEIDALRERIRGCWSPPPGVDTNSNIYVKLRVLFKPDGSLAYAPTVVEGSVSALGPAFADSARRALMVCQPFTMLKPEHYDLWKDIEFTFTPHELLGG
jgi:hypothetical protein